MKQSRDINRFVPARTGVARPLGRLESAVMDVVWSADGCLTVAEIHELLPGQRSHAYTTIKTTLERLTDKGILRRRKAGRAYVYQPVVTQPELERRLVDRALGELLHQFPLGVASFVEHSGGDPSEEKLRLLLEAVEAHDRRQQDD